jgi:hypothetical protein
VQERQHACQLDVELEERTHTAQQSSNPIEMSVGVNEGTISAAAQPVHAHASMVEEE